MSYGTASQLNALFSMGILIALVLMCVLYYLSAKRTKVFTLGRNLAINDLCDIIKAIPGHVFHHKVKSIELSGNKVVRLDCSTVKILITQNANEFKCTYKLNGFINLIFTLAVGLFGFGGVGSLFDGGGSESLAGIAIAIAIHIVRGLFLKRGRNIVVSIEEHLR